MQAKTDNSFIFSRYVRSLAESEQLAYQWMPVSFIILPEQLKSKSETRKKLHAKYTDERNNLMAFSSSTIGTILNFQCETAREVPLRGMRSMLNLDTFSHLKAKFQKLSLRRKCPAKNEGKT